MIIRSYSGRSVTDALAKVRHDLGEQALIIETRAVHTPGLLGRKSGYEVVAARDDAPVSAPAKSVSPSPSAPPAPPVLSTPTALATGMPVRLEDELAAIRRQLARLVAGQDTPTDHLGDDVAERLSESELPDDLLAELDRAVALAGNRLESGKRRDFLALVLSCGLPCAGAIDWSQRRRLMVIGPTGVGKTTTIAKLASDLVLKQRRSVALVTIDTYRIGATDQLKAYADLLGVPLDVATSPAQLGAILRRHEGRDHVLIDTAGRSPSDGARVQELKAFCRAAPGIGVMLAISATSGRAEFASVVERFSLLPLEHTVVTKLDECVAAGRLYGCLRRHRLPLNYFTTGQEVPDDIIPARAEVLPQRLLDRARVAAA
jgi:flagellar biosynthesis protein FlhF